MTARPTFCSTPVLVVGIPVALVKRRFNWVIPNALFNEKLTPGIFILHILLSPRKRGK